MDKRSRPAAVRHVGRFAVGSRANKCIHIEGGDFFGSMTRLRSRLLEHGYKEVDRSGSGILVHVLLKKGRVKLSFSIDEKPHDTGRSAAAAGDAST